MANYRTSLHFPKTNVMETRKARADIRYMNTTYITHCVSEFRQWQRHHCVPEAISWLYALHTLYGLWKLLYLKAYKNLRGFNYPHTFHWDFTYLYPHLHSLGTRTEGIYSQNDILQTPLAYHYIISPFVVLPPKFHYHPNEVQYMLD
jgi:hypothetical protein